MTMATVAGAGHMMLTEQPKETAELILGAVRAAARTPLRRA